MSDLLGGPRGDLGDAYVSQRGEAIRRDNDPDAWFDSLSQNDATQTSPSKPPNPAPSADDIRDQPGDESDPRKNPLGAWLTTTLGTVMGVADFQRRANRALGRTAKDVGKGIVEAPGAAVRGAAGAGEEVFKTGDALATWLNTNVADLTVGDQAQALDDNNPTKWLAERAGEAKSIFAARQTNTGKAIEFTAQWLTSSAMAGNMAKAFGVPVNQYTKYIKDFAAGVIGFDPKEKRLSNAIDEAAPNPVTDFLKAKDDDPELFARIKSGLETAGISTVADGAITGLRYLKSALKAADEGTGPWGARSGKPAPVVAKESVAAKLPPDETPAVVVTANNNQQFGELATKYLNGKVPDAPVQVNLDRFADKDSIGLAIADISRMLPKQDAIPMDTTLRQARALGIEPEALMQGLEGKIFDRRQISAGWMLFQGAAKKVSELGRIAAQTGATEDVARFNAAFQTSFGILQTVRGQSAEIARALQIHGAMRKASGDQMKALEKLIEESGGREVSLEIANKMATLNQYPELAAKFISETSKATTRDQITYAWSNILLSNPASHVANVLDTTLATLGQIPETWFASKIGSDVVAGEATAKLYGIVQGMKDGVRLAARTVRTGESSFSVGTRVEGFRGPLATSQDLIRSGPLGMAGDYLKMLIPTRLMQAGDELTKTMNYRGEMHALAWRDAVHSGLEGVDAARHAARLMQEAPEWLTKAAEAQAVKGTFNEPLEGFAAMLAGSVDKANVGGIPVGRIIVPFVRTPTNLLRWTLHHTPASFLSPKVLAEISAGGPGRDLALARVAAGSTVMAAFADLTINGRITGAGPKDPELRAALMRTGWQPYSIKTPEGWVSYGRSGTFGTLIGLAADATELMAGVYMREKETVNFDGEPVEDGTAAAVVFPFAQALLSKTYMSGFSNLLDAVTDPTRHGEGYLQRLVASAVPAGVGALERTIDPEIRRAKDWMEAVKGRTPGLSDGLPPRLNLWGEPIKDENGIYNLFLPARQSSDKGTVIDKEIVRLKLEVSPPKQVQSFSQGGVSIQVKLSPEQHNRLIALSGNEHKMNVPGIGSTGARDALDAMIEGRAGRLSQQWAAASDEKREIIIRDTLQKFRSAARDRLLREDGGLKDLMEREIRAKGQSIRARRPDEGGVSVGGF